MCHCQGCQWVDLEALMRPAACMTAKTVSGGKRGTRAFDPGVNHCNRLQLKRFAFFRTLCLVAAGLGSSRIVVPA